MPITWVIDNATRARRDSYSRRNIHCYREMEGVEGQEVECERVQTDAITPTPCIGYISAITNRPRLRRQPLYNRMYIPVTGDRS